MAAIPALVIKISRKIALGAIQTKLYQVCSFLIKQVKLSLKKNVFIKQIYRMKFFEIL